MPVLKSSWPMGLSLTVIPFASWKLAKIFSSPARPSSPVK